MSVVADCIFCGDEPCVTHAGKEKPKRTRKPARFAPSTSTSTPTSTSSESTSKDFVVQKKDRFAGRTESQAVTEEDDLEMREAIRNLLPILSASSRNKYRYLVEPDKSAALSKRHAEVRRSLYGNA